MNFFSTARIASHSKVVEPHIVFYSFIEKLFFIHYILTMLPLLLIPSHLTSLPTQLHLFLFTPLSKQTSKGTNKNETKKSHKNSNKKVFGYSHNICVRISPMYLAGMTLL